MPFGDPVGGGREPDPDAELIAGNRTASIVQPVVEFQVDDRSRDETGLPVRSDIAQPTCKLGRKCLRFHVDAELDLTNDAQVILEWKTVKAQRAPVIRRLLQWKPPERPK